MLPPPVFAGLLIVYRHRPGVCDLLAGIWRVGYLEPGDVLSYLCGDLSGGEADGREVVTLVAGD